MVEVFEYDKVAILTAAPSRSWEGRRHGMVLFLLSSVCSMLVSINVLTSVTS